MHGALNKMYTRKKVLYNLIKELGNPSNLVIQKSMFLLTHNNYGCEKLYDFFPDKRGCFSIRLRTDYRNLTDENYLEEDYVNSRFRIIPKDEYTENITFRVDNNITVAIKQVAELAHGMNDYDLIKYTYDLCPYYAIRSENIFPLNAGSDFEVRLKKEKTAVEKNEHAIYTIGYEGRSIDGLVNELIRKNIKTLFDVRKNAFSMQREFSKKSLKEALNEVEIAYFHCPEVGIVSEKRKELLPSGKQKELFDWYKENVLPKSRLFVNKTMIAFEKGNIAFMCYEKNPIDCHRSRLAEYCLNEDARFSKVIHI